MTNIEKLIANLSNDLEPKKIIHSPFYYVGFLALVILFYGIASQVLLGFRDDISIQIARPVFILEIILMFLLLITSLFTSIVSMYPDSYQKPSLLKLPYIFFTLIVLLVSYQIFMPVDKLMVIAVLDHGIKCSLCIAAISIIPSAIIFSILRKGASTNQFQSGTFAVLCSSTIGCITLRLSEVNDSLVHLASWHYLPTFIFAALGAVLGKWLLRW